MSAWNDTLETSEIFRLLEAGQGLLPCHGYSWPQSEDTVLPLLYKSTAAIDRSVLGSEDGSPRLKLEPVSTSLYTPNPSQTKYKGQPIENMASSDEFKKEPPTAFRNERGPASRQCHHLDRACSKSSSTDGDNAASYLIPKLHPYFCPSNTWGGGFWPPDSMLGSAWEDHYAARISSGPVESTQPSHPFVNSSQSSPSRAPSLASSVSTLKSDKLSPGTGSQQHSQLLQPKWSRTSPFPSRMQSQLSNSTLSDRPSGVIDSLRLSPEHYFEEDRELSYCDSSISSDNLDSTSSIQVFSETPTSSLSSLDDTLPIDPETGHYNFDANLFTPSFDPFHSDDGRLGNESSTASEWPQRILGLNPGTNVVIDVIDEASASMIISNQEMSEALTQLFPCDKEEMSSHLNVWKMPSEEDLTDQKATKQPPVKKTAHSMIKKRYRTNLNDKIAALRDSVPSLRVMSHPEEYADLTRLSSFAKQHISTTSPESSSSPGKIGQNMHRVMASSSKRSPQLGPDFEAGRRGHLEMAFDSGINVSKSIYHEGMSFAAKEGASSCGKCNLVGTQVSLSFPIQRLT